MCIHMDNAIICKLSSSYRQFVLAKKNIKILNTVTSLKYLDK